MVLQQLHKTGVKLRVSLSSNTINPFLRIKLILIQEYWQHQKLESNLSKYGNFFGQ